MAGKTLHGIEPDEYWHCRLIWLSAFVVILPVAIVASLTAWHWQPWDAGPGGYESPFREADLVSSRILGIVYSSH